MNPLFHNRHQSPQWTIIRSTSAGCKSFNHLSNRSESKNPIKMKCIAVCFAALLAVNCCSAQFFLQQPIAYQMAAAHQPMPNGNPGTPHRAVEINAAHEALLPPELIKSKKFYENPRAASALMKDSWFGDKETQVFDREAEKIPREKIFKIARDAGFIRR